MERVIIDDNLYKYIGYRFAMDLFYEDKVYIEKNSIMDLNKLCQIYAYRDSIKYIILNYPSNNFLSINDVIISEVKRNLKESVDFFLDNYSFSEKENIKELESIIYIIYDSILSIPAVITNLEIYINGTDTSLSHALRVSVLSIVLAIKSGLKNTQVVNLGIAALFHDIGKVFLYRKFPKLSNPQYKYTLNDFNIIKDYPLIGFNLLKNCNDIPESVKRIILLHHVWDRPRESYSNVKKSFTSFPLMMNNTELNQSNKNLEVNILQIVDNFDTLISFETPYRNKLKNEEAIKFIDYFAVIKYSQKAVDIFKKYISKYPIGCIVILNTGQKGIVLGHTSICEKPIIRIISHDPMEGRIINLKEDETNKLYIIKADGIENISKLLNKRDTKKLK